MSRRNQKRAPCRARFRVAGRAGFEPATGFTQHSLSRRAHSATLAPPHFDLRFQIDDLRLSSLDLQVRQPSIRMRKSSGGSWIRTHVGVTQTCFQDMRLQPLGHPSRRGRFYHKFPCDLPRRSQSTQREEEKKMRRGEAAVEVQIIAGLWEGTSCQEHVRGPPGRSGGHGWALSRRI